MAILDKKEGILGFGILPRAQETVQGILERVKKKIGE